LEVIGSFLLLELGKGKEIRGLDAQPTSDQPGIISTDIDQIPGAAMAGTGDTGITWS